MRTRWIVVCFAAVLTLVAGSCSSSGDNAAKSGSLEVPGDTIKKNDTGDKKDSGTSPNASSDVCRLLTLEDAEAAVGGIKLKLDEGFRDGACDYPEVDPSDMVTVGLTYEPGELEGRNLKEFADVLADEDGAKAVDGVGDGAYALKVISSASSARGGRTRRKQALVRYTKYARKAYVARDC